MTIETLIAIAGAVIATASAVFSRMSAKAAQVQAKAMSNELNEARKQTALARDALDAVRVQNDISLHTHRLEIYRALLVFQQEIIGKGRRFDRSRIFDLWAHVKISEFYFSQETASGLEKVIDLAISLTEDLDDQFQEVAPHTDLISPKVNEILKRKRALQSAIDQVNSAMRNELRVVR